MRTKILMMAVAILLTCTMGVQAADSFKDLNSQFNTQRRARDYNATLKTGQQALAAASDNEEKAVAYYMIATSYYYQRAYDKALETLNTGTALENVSIGRLVSLYGVEANVYNGKRDYAGTRQAYDKILALDGISNRQRLSTLNSKASSYLNDKPPALDKARELFTRVKDDAKAEKRYKALSLYGLARVNQAEKKYDQANQELQKALEIPKLSASDRGRFQMSIGDNYRLSGDILKAVATYQKLVDDPKSSSYLHTRALVMIGQAYYSHHDYVNARAAYQKIADMGDKAYAPYRKSVQHYLDKVDKAEARAKAKATKEAAKNANKK